MMDNPETRGERPSWIGIIAISLATLLAFGLWQSKLVPIPQAFSNFGGSGGKHRVVGHSMEPSLRGSRLPAVCSRCDARMQVFESRLKSPVWLCPQCAKPLQVGLPGGAEGELVTVRALGLADRMERDDLVVFRDQVRGQWHVKRVVGLSGERLAIQRGDLAIDGQVIRKSIWRFLQSATLLAIWHAESPFIDRWHRLDGKESGLTYRHRSPWPRKSSGYSAQPASVTDEDWRDADTSWPMATVDDVGVVMELSDISVGFSMEVVGYHPFGRWQVQLHRMESGNWRAVLGSAGSPQRYPASELKAGSSSSIRIVVAHVDSAVRVGIEGGEEQWWQWPAPSLSQSEVTEEKQSQSAVSESQPLQIRWSKEGGHLNKASVVRDVHYRGPNGELTWEATVPSAHLYLLGDHPAGSLDSRQQGPLRFESNSLVGRVEGLGSWRERLELQESDLGSRETVVFP